MFPGGIDKQHRTVVGQTLVVLLYQSDSFPPFLTVFPDF